MGLTMKEPVTCDEEFILFYTNFLKTTFMKIAKLLVLTALWLVAGSVKAAVPDGVWTMPEPQGLEFTTFTDDGTRYYLYNPAAKMFFASGNNWNTQASLRTFGNEIWLQEATEADAPEGSYELWNNNVNNPARNTGSLNMFTDDGNSTWVDHGSQGNYSWAYEIVGDCVRFQNVALIADKPEFAGQWLGFDGTFVTKSEGSGGSNRDAYTAVLRHVDPAKEGVSVLWKAVTVESYEAFAASEGYTAYAEGVKSYIASFGLKDAITAAEALPIDVTAALAVYSNTASTADELAAAATKLNELVEVKTALKAVIEEYEAKGFTETEAVKAVLNNTAATKAEVEKAHADLDTAYAAWGKTHASVENPVDMTFMIKNPHFDNADCTTGWSQNDGLSAFGRGGTVSDGAEHYAHDFDSYQTITGLAPGVYAVGVYGYYRAGNYGGDAERHWLANDAVSKAVKLYGTVGDKTYETPVANVMSGGQAEAVGQGEITSTYTDADGNEVTVYVPNTMQTADYYFHTLNVYANRLLVAVDESGELTIGVKKSGTISGDWAMFDDFSLTYYGTGTDAAKLFLDETIKNYSEITVEEGTVYTESYLTAYNESLNKEIVANSFEEVSTAMAEIESAKQAFEKNIKLWKDWQAKITEIKTKYLPNPDYDGLFAMDDLGDYDMEADAILEEAALTNEELEAELAKIEEMMKAVRDEFLAGPVEDGTDMTRYITNPGFDDDADIDSGKAEGWTIDSGTGGNITRGPLGEGNKTLMEGALGYMNYCFEAWHRYNWDVWQEIENLPKGMYELNVQGYVRCEVSGYQRGDDINPDYPSPIYLYMNSAKAQFPSVYSESPADYGNEMVQVEDWYQESINDKPYPNSMGGAAQCFGWGMYKMSAYGLIAKKGDKFRIGVKMNGTQDWWCIWDSFKLTYRKPTIDIVKPILEEELAKLDETQGVGSEIIENLNKVKEDAAAAIASNDADQMFDALVAVYDISDAIQASSARFAELNTANEDLAYAIPFAEDLTIRAEGDALYQQIFNGIENHTIATEEVDGLLNEITKMINRLGIPAGMADASDANPVECTTVIINPSYIDGNDKGWTGGAKIEASATDAEKFNTNYNYYQKIQGLPAGTYQVTLTGYYRAGSAANDYTTWIESPAENNNALLYAVGEANDTCSVPMMRLASQAQVYESLPDSYAWASEENLLAVPNSMTTGGDLFMTENEATGKNFYAGNRVTVKVGEDGNLTIGLKKNVTLQDDWTLWTNWQLFYYGKNSGLTPDIETAIKEVGSGEAVKVEIFNVNGARLNKAQKGLVIVKKTMSDGSVKVVKKVQK
jgi:hypothetical protein